MLYSHTIGDIRNVEKIIWIKIISYHGSMVNLQAKEKCIFTLKYIMLYLRSDYKLNGPEYNPDKINMFLIIS
jgi:hypothetical protein